MSLDIKFIPTKPFEEFKWQWASVQCTEGLNDPVILLGVLSKMRKLEGDNKYSSEEFSQELLTLENDVKDTISVRLADRTGTRNLIRNSGQYWKAVGLIDDKSRGYIKLTPFGRKVADRDISQAEFAATTIKTLTLPNPHVQSEAVCQKWLNHGLSFRPLMLILDILMELYTRNPKEKYLSGDELIKIVIPLSGVNAGIEDYANFILWNREKRLELSTWPNCCLGANDNRMAREFLLFLCNYGYLNRVNIAGRFDTKFSVNTLLLDEICEIAAIPNSISADNALEEIRRNDIASDIERKRVLAFRTERPNQSKFRKSVLGSFSSRCILTNVAMPEVLEAAHIKPVQYKGNDTIGNGLCMRLDMHQLFDTGHLRITVDGDILLSPRAAIEYGSTIPSKIIIPGFVDKSFIKWRWDNYNGI